MPPEMFDGSGCTMDSDWWSFVFEKNYLGDSGLLHDKWCIPKRNQRGRLVDVI